MQSSSQAEAERLLGIANTLIEENDLTAARDFGLLAQETDSLLEGPDQITAIVDVLIASNQQINNHHNYYNILQIENNRYNDPDHIKQQYHCLAVLLHPDKNKFSSAGTAFKLVNDAWDILSDPVKKSTYDNRLFDVFTNQDHENEKMHVKRNNVHGNIWTLCPYCYNLYEYPKVYEGCCLRCVNCERAFQVVVIPAQSMPEIVPGKEAYYFRQWPCFPIGFVLSNTVPQVNFVEGLKLLSQTTPKQPEKTCSPTTRTSSRKRGRPVKNPLL
ncbi:DnaJ domain-containing protein [Tanacetum coccineum]